MSNKHQIVLSKLLQLVSNHRRDSSVVYPFLQEHIDYLDNTFLKLIQGRFKTIPNHIKDDEQKA